MQNRKSNEVNEVFQFFTFVKKHFYGRKYDKIKQRHTVKWKVRETYQGENCDISDGESKEYG